MTTATKATSVQLPSNTIVRASAGSGKTYGLTVRFIQLLAAGARPDAILATTFTRKAAGEILGRVLGRLAQASSSDDACELLSHDVGRKIDRDEAGRLLRQVVGQLHRLRISTLDSFFGQVAQCHGLELALPPRWRIAEGTADARGRDDAIQDVFREESQQDLLTLLHLLEQGDTSRRVAEQTRRTVDDLYQLFRTSPADAWHSIPRRKQLPDDEVAAAIERFLGTTFEKKSFQKAHATACERVVDRDWNGLLEAGLAKKIVAGETTYYNSPIDDVTLDVYDPIVQYAANELTNGLFDRTWATHELLKRFDERYSRIKEHTGQLTFDDVTHALKRASWSNLGERTAFRLDGRIEHLLLDEFQDTSWPQWQVLEPLVRETTAIDADKTFYCVGDVKQAIYGWRGGHAGILQGLDEHLDNVTTDSLSCSYRSAPAVIEAVNRVFGSLETNPALTRWSDAAEQWSCSFEPHKTKRTDLTGYFRLREAPPAPDGEKQKPYTLAAVADEVAEIYKATPRHQIGVLLRSNDDVGSVIRDLRIRHEIEASEEAGATLTSSTAVLLVMSALRLADHPGDSVARTHVATSPLAAEFGDLAHNDEVAAARCSRRIRRALLRDGYGKTIQRWAEQLAPSCDARDARRLDQLIDLAFAYEPMATLRPADFVRHVELERIADPGSARVRVMNIHQSKGLEFDAVVMAAPSESLNRAPKIVASSPSPFDEIDHVLCYANESLQSLLPPEARHTIDSHKTNETREQLNVLYVAMTRAIRALYIVVPPAGRPNDSWAWLLRHALVGDSGDTPVDGDSGAGERRVLFEVGEADWFAHDADDRAVEPRPLSSGGAGEPTADPHQIVFAGQPRASYRQLTPSHSSDDSTLEVSNLLSPQSAAARRRGSLYHDWFELVEWLDDGPPTDERLTNAAARFHLTRTELERHIAEFHRLAAQPNVQRALSRATYTVDPPGPTTSKDALAGATPSVWRELPFALTNDAGWTTGRFDRLIVMSDGQRPIAAEVIDFKTDAIDKADAAALNSATQTHRAQMQAYGRATCKLLGLPVDAVRLRLLFVTVDAVVDVPHAAAAASATSA